MAPRIDPKSLLLALALCGSSALPAAAAEVALERLAWPEVARRIASGTTTLIIPTGGTEQNGAHMALGKHNAIVAVAAARIAAELGDALVAPVLAYVPEGDPEQRTGHMAYPGTLSVPDGVFAAVLDAAAASGRAAGFKTIVLLGDSGGNQAAQAEVAQRLSAAWAADGVRVINAASYYDGAAGEALLRREGETAATIGTHAGIRDTSELMAVDPTLVDLPAAAPDAAGASGDARRATAERGKRLLDARVAAAVAEIRAARAAPTEAPPGLLARLVRMIFG